MNYHQLNSHSFSQLLSLLRLPQKDQQLLSKRTPCPLPQQLLPAARGVQLGQGARNQTSDKMSDVLMELGEIADEDDPKQVAMPSLQHALARNAFSSARAAVSAGLGPSCKAVKVRLAANRTEEQ